MNLISSKNVGIETIQNLNERATNREHKETSNKRTLYLHQGKISDIPATHRFWEINEEEFKTLGKFVVPENGKKYIEVDHDWTRKYIKMMLDTPTPVAVQNPDIENGVFEYQPPKLGPNDSALVIVSWTLGSRMYTDPRPEGTYGIIEPIP